jgi:hypothetical protein
MAVGTSIKDAIIGNKVLVMLLALFVILGTMYSVTTPLFEAPDETGHFDYVLYLIRERRLPRIGGEVYEAKHPPLHYAVAAIATFWVDTSNLSEVRRLNPNFIWFGEGDETNIVIHGTQELFPYHGTALAMHIGRLISVAWGAITVLATYLIAREVFPRSRWIPLGAAAINAFIPQFIFNNSYITNDPLVTALSSLSLWQMVRIIRGRSLSRSTFLWLGLLIGLALLAKQSAVVLVPLAALTIIVAAVRHPPWQRIAKGAAITTAIAFILTHWWYFWNLYIYGDPMGQKAYLAIDYYPMVFNSWDVIRPFLGIMHASSWARFGWMNVPVDDFVIEPLKLTYLASAIGLVLLLLRKNRYGQDQFDGPALGLLFVTICASWALVVALCMMFGAAGMQGRFLFPSISAFSTLVALGLASLVPRRWSALPLAAFIIPLALLAALCPFIYIMPAYR